MHLGGKRRFVPLSDMLVLWIKLHFCRCFPRSKKCHVGGPNEIRSTFTLSNAKIITKGMKYSAKVICNVLK